MRLGVEDEATLNLKRRIEAEGKPRYKLTGEFIIFHQYENKNFYLALWKHHDKEKQDSSSYSIEELKKLKKSRFLAKRNFLSFQSKFFPIFNEKYYKSDRSKSCRCRSSVKYSLRSMSVFLIFEQFSPYHIQKLFFPSHQNKFDSPMAHRQCNLMSLYND